MQDARENQEGKKAGKNRFDISCLRAFLISFLSREGSDFLWKARYKITGPRTLAHDPEVTVRALVIDDSRAVRLLISQVLAELGMDVMQAAHGQEALDLLRQ